MLYKKMFNNIYPFANRGVVGMKVSFYQKYVSAVGITQAASARLQVGAAGGDTKEC